MSTLPKDFSEVLQKLGISQKSLMKIRFGGVVGKQALIGFGGLLGLIVLAVKSEDKLMHWGCLAGIIVVSLLTIVAMGFHGHKHPIEATLEGGEMVVMHHLQQQTAAKGMEAIPYSPPVPEGIGTKALKDAKES